jgi:hypothetical protein
MSCLLPCFAFIQELLLISFVAEAHCILLNPYTVVYISFLMNSTSKAMATVEALLSRHIAATLHLSLIRFVSSQDEGLYFLFEHTFPLNSLPCSWDI